MEAVLEPSQLTIGALVEAARAGDRDAFRRLVEPDLAAALGTARIVTRSEADASDAVQEALLSAWQGMDGLREPGAFRANAEAGVRVGTWAGDPASGAPLVVEERPDCYFATQMRIDGRLFVWAPDPDTAYDPASLDVAIGLVGALPADAVDTGYRSEGRELHLDPDGSAAYVVLPDGIQRWAHVPGDDYQRTDCN